MSGCIESRGIAAPSDVRLAKVFRRSASAGQQVEEYRGRAYSQGNPSYLDSLLEPKSAQPQSEGLLLSDSLNGFSEE